MPVECLDGSPTGCTHPAHDLRSWWDGHLNAVLHELGVSSGSAGRTTRESPPIPPPLPGSGDPCSPRGATRAPRTRERPTTMNLTQLLNSQHATYERDPEPAGFGRGIDSTGGTASSSIPKGVWVADATPPPASTLASSRPSPKPPSSGTALRASNWVHASDRSPKPARPAKVQHAFPSSQSAQTQRDDRAGIETETLDQP